MPRAGLQPGELPARNVAGDFSVPMAIYSYIDPSRRRLLTHGEGLLTFADIHSHVHMELADDVAGYAELADCSTAVTDISADEIFRLSQERIHVDTLQRRPGPVAIVAKDDALFGMFRMFDALTDQLRPIRVFRDTREAEAWLAEIEMRTSLANVYTPSVRRRTDQLNSGSLPG